MQQGLEAKNSVLESLRAIIKWLGIATSALVGEARELGEQEENLEKLHGVISAIEIPPGASPTVDLMANLSTYIESKATYLWSMDPGDPRSYGGAPFITTSGSVVTGTGSAFVLTPDFDWGQYPSELSILREGLDRAASRAEERSKVENWLLELDPSIAAEFAQAWQTWFTGTEDPIRGAAFPMRETVRHVIDKLSSVAPDSESLDTAREKVVWIAGNLLKDSSARQVIIEDGKLYVSIRKGLNRAHKLGSLEREQIEAYMVGAEGFLLDLVEHVDLEEFRRRLNNGG